MSTTTDHRIETLGSVSLAVAGGSAQGADVKSMPVSENGLSSELLEEPAELAAEKVRGQGGLRLMGEGGLLPGACPAPVAARPGGGDGRASGRRGGQGVEDLQQEQGEGAAAVTLGQLGLESRGQNFDEVAVAAVCGLGDGDVLVVRSVVGAPGPTVDGRRVRQRLLRNQ